MATRSESQMSSWTGSRSLEPGKRFSMKKLHQITYQTGKHLVGPTSQYLGIKATGKLNPCEY